MSAKSVFLVGPGFIGWNVLDLLVEEGYSVTALVRRDDHAAELHKSGAKTVKGSLNDHDLIAEQTAKSDIVFHTATADHLPSAQAILDGVKTRAAEGKQTIYIHTSGTVLMADQAAGEFKTEKIYYDNKPEDIEALPITAPHRRIDYQIVTTARELGEKAKIAIMLPPLIYGFNPKHRRLSIQMPVLARFAAKHGYAPYVGKGLSVQSVVHVMDLGRAYMTLLHHMEFSASSSEFTANPYVFPESGELSWHEFAEVIAKSMVREDLIKDQEPRTVGTELYHDLFGAGTPLLFGLNSRSKAIRLREWGWQPKAKSVRESWEEDELPQLMMDEGWVKK